MAFARALLAHSEGLENAGLKEFTTIYHLTMLNEG